MEQGTHKDTVGKVKLNLVPPRSQEAIARVREFGVNKYKDPWGWMLACTEDEFIEAVKRHLNKRDRGEEIDPESGLPHIYHALCGMAMAVELFMVKNEKK